MQDIRKILNFVYQLKHQHTDENIDSSVINDTQPMPIIHSDESGISITRLVIAECPGILKSDFIKREQKGIATYGTTLQAFNGRDAAIDLYEEMLDACQYAKQKCVENPEELKDQYIYDSLISITEDIKNAILAKNY